MIALDTNVLVRYIIRDDKSQTRKADIIIEQLTVDVPAFISCIVLCELNWVLKTTYKVSKADCIETLNNVFSIAVFDVERQGECMAALREYETGAADFSDYLIQNIAEQVGYDTVITFDK